MATTVDADPDKRDAVANSKVPETDNPHIKSVLQDFKDLEKDYMELEVCMLWKYDSLL